MEPLGKMNVVIGVQPFGVKANYARPAHTYVEDSWCLVMQICSYLEVSVQFQ